MNTTADELTMYVYEYNSTCDHDPNPVLSDTVLQCFYFVLFCFGLLGEFNQFDIN